MIITRAPLRVSLGGGGTDLPSYSKDHGGFVLSAAIDKYVYITVNRSFRPQITLKYSHLEEVDSVDDVKHPIFREALRLIGITDYIDIASVGDVPASTGLGSSGSFTVALLKALHMFKKNHVSSRKLAEQAFQIEAEILGQPVGKQDQYISAIGGINSFTFFKDGSVDYLPLNLSEETIHRLEDNLLLFFTGYSRDAADILTDQNKKSEEKNLQMLQNLNLTKRLGYLTRDSLERGQLKDFAHLMHEHWIHKRDRSEGMSNQHINEIYNFGLESGALGGKLVGAGAGGFLMFYTEDRIRLQSAMKNKGLREIRFKFDFEGVKCLTS